MVIAHHKSLLYSYRMTTAQVYALHMSESDRMSRADAARVLGVSVQTIDRYGEAGLLTRHKNRVTGRVTFPRDQVEELRRTREGEDVR